MKLKFLFFFLLFTGIYVSSLQAQDTVVMGKAPVKISTQTQKIDSKFYLVHIVERGQTLFSIARAYGVKYPEIHIKTDVDKLSVGDTAWVPTTEAHADSLMGKYDGYFNYYEVQPKETLYSIAKKFNLKESDIIDLNPILSQEVIKAGQVIKIPKKDVKISAKTSFGKEDGRFVEVIKNDTSSEDEDTSGIIIRERRSKTSVNVALFIPLYLDQISQISLTKADIEQKRKREYSSFQFIQFYEGILLALNKLEEKGFNVKLTVYDVGENDTTAIKSIFAKPEIQDVDFIVALLYQKGFATAAKLAKKNNIFIVNPLSEHAMILENNPYVFKLSPSPESYARSFINYVTKNVSNPNMIVIYSSSSKKQTTYNAFKVALAKQTTVPYTLFQWEASVSALRTQLANGKKNIVVSAYDNPGLSEEAYLARLLNIMVAQKSNPPTLFSSPNILNYKSIDLTYLQRVNFSFLQNVYLDEGNPTHKEFIELFKTTYKTYPNADFAASGYDILLHFVMGLESTGEKFWKDPNLKTTPLNLLNPLYFKRLEESNGFENIRCNFYKLTNYQITPLPRKED